MSSEGWMNFTLEDVFDFRNGKTSPTRIETGSYPVYGSNGVIGYANEFNIDAETIIIGRVGAYCGSLYYYKGKCWVTDNALIGKVKDQHDGLAVFYLLKMLDLNNYKAGSSQPLLNQSILNSIKIHIPKDKKHQHRIADILYALDDKIELNRQTNATLEATAQAIFDEWFVRFNFPGDDGERVESELGPIPRGWRVGSVGEVLIRMPVGKKYDFKMAQIIGRVPILDQSHFNVIGYHNDAAGIKASWENPVIVFSNHRCYTDIIHFPFSVIQNVLPFIGKNVDTRWLYCATNGIISYSEYKGHWPDFISKKIIIPPNEITQDFGKIIKPLQIRIYENKEETNTLAQTRDALLPKLMNGEIEV